MYNDVVNIKIKALLLFIVILFILFKNRKKKMEQ